MDPDPAPHEGDVSCEYWFPDPPILHFDPPCLQCEPLKLPDFDFNADPDPAFRSNVEPDPASKNNVDPPGSGSTTLPSSGGKKQIKKDLISTVSC